MSDPGGSAWSGTTRIAEAATLAAALMDLTAADAMLGHLRRDDYAVGRHRMIYDAVAAARDAGETPDVLSVTRWLEERGRLDDAGGHAYLAEVLDVVPTSAQIDVHARIVRDAATRRRLKQAALETLRDLDECGDDTTDDILARSERRLSEVRERTASSYGIRSARDMARDALAFVRDRRMAARDGRPYGVRTGITLLDRMTTGMQPGEMWVIAGRPGMGKTALALQIAATAAKHGTRVAVESLEMSSQELALRWLSGESGVPLDALRGGHELTTAASDRLDAAAARLSGWPLDVDDVPASGVDELRARMRHAVRVSGAGLLVVDYIQLVPGRGNARWEDVGEVTRGLKLAARELGVPLLAVSQLSRAPEARPTRRPQLSDLRESGSIEQDADTVLLLYRPEYYMGPDDLARHPEAIGRAEIKLAKQRNGPTGTILTRWEAQHGRFYALAPERDAQRAEAQADAFGGRSR